jgi:hypothetical protein
MGHLQENHGMMLLKNVPPGTCPECAVKHEPDQPHNKDSLVYQYNFYDKHGKWPTWTDAMAHCSGETKSIWTEMLSAHGVSLNGADK